MSLVLQLSLRPESLREANRFVDEHHRHHGPVRGHKFGECWLYDEDQRFVDRLWSG